MCIVTGRVLNLAALGFTIAFSGARCSQVLAAVQSAGRGSTGSARCSQCQQLLPSAGHGSSGRTVLVRPYLSAAGAAACNQGANITLFDALRSGGIGSGPQWLCFVLAKA